MKMRGSLRTRSLIALTYTREEPDTDKTKSDRLHVYHRKGTPFAIQAARATTGI